MLLDRRTFNRPTEHGKKGVGMSALRGSVRQCRGSAELFAAGRHRPIRHSPEPTCPGGSGENAFPIGQSRCRRKSKVTAPSQCWRPIAVCEAPSGSANMVRDHQHYAAQLNLDTIAWRDFNSVSHSGSSQFVCGSACLRLGRVPHRVSAWTDSASSWRGRAGYFVLAQFNTQCLCTSRTILGVKLQECSIGSQISVDRSSRPAFEAYYYPTPNFYCQSFFQSSR